MGIDWQAFTDSVTHSLKTSGATGATGANRQKAEPVQGTYPGPTGSAEPAPIENDWGRDGLATGANKDETKQSLDGGGPTGPTGPSDFEQGPTQNFDAVSRLRRMSQPDEFWGLRWVTLIRDAEDFLASWGDQAKHLGWTELHLFGVHPKVPAARFDVMGLIPLLDGGRVIALTDATATIRKPSGSIQRHAKRDPGCAVPIWEIA